MQSQEIPKQQWAGFLKEFSRAHLGQQARLWVTGPDAGLMREATTCRWSALTSIGRPAGSNASM